MPGKSPGAYHILCKSFLVWFHNPDPKDSGVAPENLCWVCLMRAFPGVVWIRDRVLEYHLATRMNSGLKAGTLSQYLLQTPAGPEFVAKHSRFLYCKSTATFFNTHSVS